MSYPSQPEVAPVQHRSRPGSVTVAATLQLLLAVTFLIAATVALVYGPDAQAAGEAELVRQGFPAQVLTEHNVRFDEGVGGIVPAYVIAVALATLALLNLAGKRIGRLLSWICQPIVLIAGAVIMSSQVFVVQFLTSAFESSGDATLRSIKCAGSRRRG